MQIRFPRRLQLGLRPWYGLTLRQLLYVVVAGVTGGACILFIQTDFLIRVLIGLIPIAIGLGLAFFRKDGMSVEQWIITWLKFAVHPQKRVWSRGDATDRHTQVADMQMDAPPSDAPPAAAPVRTAQRDAAPVQRVRLLRPTLRGETSAPSPVLVFIDLAVLLSLFALAVYLFSGGFADVQGWFAVQFGP